MPGFWSTLKNSGMTATQIVRGSKRGLRPVTSGADIVSGDDDLGLTITRDVDNPTLTAVGFGIIIDHPETESPGNDPPNFTDPRYWVQWMQASAGIPSEDPIYLVENGAFFSPSVVIATNVCETWDGEQVGNEFGEAVGCHLLTPGERVYIFTVADANGFSRFVFFRPIDVINIKLTGNLSGNGTYSAQQWKRPTTDFDGTTDPNGATIGTANTDAVIIAVNTSEFGITPAGHKIDTAGDDVFFMAYIERVNADGSVEVSFQSNGSCTGTASTTLSGSGAEASTTSWMLSSTSSRVTVAWQTREFWDSSSDILYGFQRSESHECGLMVSVSVETRYTVDPAQNCP